MGLRSKRYLENNLIDNNYSNLRTTLIVIVLFTPSKN